MRIKLAIMALLCAGHICASDVIVTKEAKKIDAKILEVSSDEIKYKKKSNPNGPTFVINTSEIQTVIYDNGEVEIFKDKEEKQSVATEAETKQVKTAKENPSKTAEEDELKKMTYSGSNVDTTTSTDNSSDSKSEKPKKKIHYMSDDVVYTTEDGKLSQPSEENAELEFRRLNGTSITSGQYEDFLRKYCFPAYEKYKKGNERFVFGTVTTILGELLFMTGVACLVSYNSSVRYDNPSYDSDTGMWAYGTAATIVGGVCLVTGIPFWVTGAVGRKRSADVYNKECGGNDTAFEYRIGYTGKGLGLALNF